MPRNCLINQLMEYKINQVMSEIEFLIDVDCDEEIEEALNDFMVDVVSIQSCSRRRKVEVPKSVQRRSSILCAFDDCRFFLMMRVTKLQFQFLHDLIMMDAVFQNSSLQIPTDQQLAIVLYRLGACGESASIRKLASLFGIEDSGTLGKITERVFTAILRKMPDYIKWPSESEREQLVAATFNELPHCIGYIDGNEIKLADKPRIAPDIYFSRQRNYSINLQVVCDHKFKIRDVVVGNPGSYHDAKVFRNSKIWQKRCQLFSDEQWLAGDSAYPLSKFVIPPYRSNSQAMDAERRHRFNRRHSEFRVRVENCFGILKEKFGSLKEMRVQIGSERSQKYFCKWVLVCCVLHNILLEERDICSYESESEGMSDNNDVDYGNTTVAATFAEQKRQRLYSMMFE